MYVCVCGWVDYPTHRPQWSHFRKGECSCLCSRRFAVDFLCVPVFRVFPLAVVSFLFLGCDKKWTAATVLGFDFVVRRGLSGRLWHCKYVKNVGVWSFSRLPFSPHLFILGVFLPGTRFEKTLSGDSFFFPQLPFSCSLVCVSVHSRSFIETRGPLALAVVSSKFAHARFEFYGAALYFIK